MGSENFTGYSLNIPFCRYAPVGSLSHSLFSRLIASGAFKGSRKVFSGCGWKGISIALTIRSLDRTYRMGVIAIPSPPNAG